MVHFFNFVRYLIVVSYVNRQRIPNQSSGGMQAKLFRNIKLIYFVFNVEFVCNIKLFIRDIDAHWSGPTHGDTV